MISETMPLNEWPSVDLYKLRDLLLACDYSIAGDRHFEIVTFEDELLKVLKTAIKDAQERESKLPFK